MTQRAKSYHDKTIRGIRKNLMEISAQSNQIKVIYCSVHKDIPVCPKYLPKRPPIFHPGQNLPIRDKKIQLKTYHKQMGKKMEKRQW